MTSPYKAAYYKGGGTNAGYWTYPTKSNTTPSNILSSTGTNNANFDNGGYDTDPTNGLTPVGAFAASPGPYGTYDQGGDVSQWNEADLYGFLRGTRGGGWGSDYRFMTDSYRSGATPASGNNGLGFRVASVPEPGAMILLLGGAIAVCIWRRRRK